MTPLSKSNFATGRVAASGGRSTHSVLPYFPGGANVHTYTEYTIRCPAHHPKRHLDRVVCFQELTVVTNGWTDRPTDGTNTQHGSSRPLTLMPINYDMVIHKLIRKRTWLVI